MQMNHVSHEGFDIFIHDHVSLYAPRTRVDIYIYQDDVLMHHCVTAKKPREKLIAWAKEIIDKDVSKCQRPKW